VDDDLADEVRMNATLTLGRVVSADPSIGVDVVEDAVECFDAHHHKLRNNALALVADVCKLHADVAEPHVDAVAATLAADDDYARINATCVLGRVAEDFPDSVEHLTDRVVELLDDDHAVVRKNACWILGHIGAEDAESKLEARLDDEDPEVCQRASWALERCRTRRRSR
jgi:HEAT repeat protein